MKHLWIATIKNGDQYAYYAHDKKWKAGDEAIRYTRDDVPPAYVRAAYFLAGAACGVFFVYVGAALGAWV